MAVGQGDNIAAMGSDFQKVAIVGRHADSRVAEPMTILVSHLTKAGINVLASDDMQLDLPVTRCPEASLAARADHDKPCCPTDRQVPMASR